MTGRDALRDRLSGLRDALAAYADLPGSVAEATPAELATACTTRAAANAADRDRLGSLHHFACTGGTLISRAIAAQANVVLLSEVDPFSRLGQSKARFAPSDILTLLESGARRVSDETVEAAFLGGLQALRNDLRRRGRHLVLRDHSHSHFCAGEDLPARPLMGDMLRRRFDLRALVTVRHPLDSFLSLSQRGWVHFAPGTLEEYARRYLAFLDAYSATRLVRYEDFIADPDAVLRQMTDVLGLPFQPEWRAVFPAITLTGNSGRAGDVIAPRDRRPVPSDIAAQRGESPSYDALCARLGYLADFDAPGVIDAARPAPLDAAG